uniref:Uncharacterized protein n=1 Tax=Arundo donax TaxID=35708 RepID=A0A0A8ZIX3_ARUDO
MSVNLYHISRSAQPKSRLFTFRNIAVMSWDMLMQQNLAKYKLVM